MIPGPLDKAGFVAAGLEPKDSPDDPEALRPAVSQSLDPLYAWLDRSFESQRRSFCGTGAPPPIPTIPAGAQGRFRSDVLVLVAHPDDESMYGGGTLSALVRAGAKVHVAWLTHGEGGRILERPEPGVETERRDLPRGEVVAIRDREAMRAMNLLGAPCSYLFAARHDLDFGFEESTDSTLSAWQRALPNGVEDVVAILVSEIRRRRPRIVLTLDPHGDPEGSDHGHHKALGLLVDLAARLAAEPGHGLGRPHTIQELLSFAPAGEGALSVPIDPGDRQRLIGAYGSQLTRHSVETVGMRPTEEFQIVWRARGQAHEGSTSLLFELLQGRDVPRNRD